jgi:hypothetical protein
MAGKPSEEILKEVTNLGSTLAQLANSQLDAVLTELRGPTGAGDTTSGASARVNVGTLAFNVLQVVNKVGDLMMQLSKYDLVRRDSPVLNVRAANPLTSWMIQAGEEQTYGFLVENNGERLTNLSLSASLSAVEAGAQPVSLSDISPALADLDENERRRVALRLPAQSTGKYVLRIEVTKVDAAKPLAAKAVTVTVLPPPGQHTP